MHFDYTVGVLPASVVSALAGIATLVALVRGGATRLPVIAVLGISAGGWISAYAILNVVLQINHIPRDFVSSELANGRLALRVTSVVYGIGFVLRSWTVYKLERPPTSFGTDPYEDVDVYVAESSQGSWRPEVIISRYCRFLVAITLLWITALTGHPSVAVTTLSYLIAFGLDDFVIMADYRLRRDALPTPKCRCRCG